MPHGPWLRLFGGSQAETGVKCLGECMRNVSWSTCLQLVRQLAFLSLGGKLIQGHGPIDHRLRISKHENRERWLVRGACECLQRFPLPQHDIPGPEILMSGDFKLPDVLDAFPAPRMSVSVPSGL